MTVTVCDIEAMATEIITINYSFPIEDGDIPVRYIKLREGVFKLWSSTTWEIRAFFGQIKFSALQLISALKGPLVHSQREFMSNQKNMNCLEFVNVLLYYG